MTLRFTPLLVALLMGLGAAGAWAQSNGEPSAPSAAASKVPTQSAARPTKAATKTTPAVANGSQAGAAASAPKIVVEPAPMTPYKGKPMPQATRAIEGHEIPTSPGDLTPKATITPQINIPVGKTPPNSVSGAGMSSGSIDDAAGRCMAIANAKERDLCRERAGLGPAPR